MATFTTVFLSSTARDLQSYRDAVAEAIRKLDGYHCVRMEDFGVRDGTPEEEVRAQVATCDVFVGLIGHLRLRDPEDYVWRELSSALRGGIPVLPVLVQGATMPDASELPEELREVCRRNSISIIDQLFDASIKLLTRAIRELPCRRAGG